MVVGVGGAGYYLLRLAIRNPDVTWNRSKNPEPWEEFRNKQATVSATIHSKKEKRKVIYFIFFLNVFFLVLFTGP